MLRKWMNMHVHFEECTHKPFPVAAFMDVANLSISVICFAGSGLCSNSAKWQGSTADSTLGLEIHEKNIFHLFNTKTHTKQGMWKCRFAHPKSVKENQWWMFNAYVSFKIVSLINVRPSCTCALWSFVWFIVLMCPELNRITAAWYMTSSTLAFWNFLYLVRINACVRCIAPLLYDPSTLTFFPSVRQYVPMRPEHSQ